tara:strand:- start:541 stop:783 length:243 start_codon:yes stop_codon:yes gene_type:complete
MTTIKANPNATNSELDAKQIITNKLKTYQIECYETNVFMIEVEAQNEDEARELAQKDINSFEILDEYVSDWEINYVEEIT